MSASASCNAKLCKTGSVAWSIISGTPSGESDGVSLSAVTQLDQNVVAERLLSLCDQYQIVGTWFFSQPSIETSVQQITAHDTRHAIGLSIDESPRGGRSELARQLRREQTLLQRQGISLNSLQISSSSASEHYDLLMKHGISIIGNPPATNAARPSDTAGRALRQLRHGLWTLPTAASVTARSVTGSLCAWWRATSLVLAAAESRGNCHLSIDLGQLSPRSMQWTLISKVMRVQASLRREGRLQIATAATLASQMSTARQPVAAARSILRAA